MTELKTDYVCFDCIVYNSIGDVEFILEQQRNQKELFLKIGNRSILSVHNIFRQGVNFNNILINEVDLNKVKTVIIHLKY